MLRAKYILRANKLSALRKSKCYFSNAESAAKSFWKRFDEMRKTPTPSYKSYYSGPVVITKQKDDFQEFVTQFRKEYLKEHKRNNKMDILAGYLISQPLSITQELISHLNQDLKKSYKTNTIAIKEFDDEVFIDDISKIRHEIENAMQINPIGREVDPIDLEVASIDWLNLVVEPNSIQKLKISKVNEAQIKEIIHCRIISPLLKVLSKIHGDQFLFSYEEILPIIESTSKGFLRPDLTIEINDKFHIPFEEKLKLPNADEINENNLLDVNGVVQTLEYMLNQRSRFGIVSNFKSTIILSFLHGKQELHYKSISHQAEHLTTLGALLTLFSRTLKGKNQYGKPSVGHLKKRQVVVLSELIEKYKLDVAMKFAETIKMFKEKISSSGKKVNIALQNKTEFDDTFKCTEIINVNEKFQTFEVAKDCKKYFMNPEEFQNKENDATIEVNVFNLAKYDRFTLKDMELFENKENEFVEEFDASIREYEKIKDFNQDSQEIVQPTKVSHGYLEIKIGDEFAISGPFIANLKKLSPDSHYERYKDDLEKQLKLLHKNKMSIKNRASFNETSIPTKLNPTDVTTDADGNWCFKFPSGVRFTPEQDVKELKDL